MTQLFSKVPGSQCSCSKLTLISGMEYAMWRYSIILLTGVHVLVCIVDE